MLELHVHAKENQAKINQHICMYLCTSIIFKSAYSTQSVARNARAVHKHDYRIRTWNVCSKITKLVISRDINLFDCQCQLFCFYSIAFIIDSNLECWWVVTSSSEVSISPAAMTLDTSDTVTVYDGKLEN